jgi:TRAP-type C4-dicarboxylate transport system substrate-binding protein
MEETMMITRRTLLATTAATIAMPSVLKAAPHKLKLSHYLPPQHQINTELRRWTDELRKISNGDLDVEVFPAGQMGPPPQQFDLARKGLADISFVFTALAPGRFPMTDMMSVPFLFAHDDGKPISAAKASYIATSLLDLTVSEYAGTTVLYSVVATSIGLFMRDKLIRTPEDLSGLRIRPNSPIAASHVQAWGASPATIAPAELADAIQKGVVDGAIFNFEGGKAFQLQSAVKKVSLIADNVGYFALVMNTQSLEGLPAALRKLITDTTGPDAGRRVGAIYDTNEEDGYKVFKQAGVEIIQLVGKDIEPFKKRTGAITEQQISALEGKGIKVRELLKKVREMVDKA